ncbi:hypothetical protein [Nonomuraea lactucae]|uniref:hypothetical protein n=1 Tax=Nonomuraea lactucae TaxID=2249762 RepID=UPI0013B36B82|nr:hypothetical protein [Nonomuraea lactucae]
MSRRAVLVVVLALVAMVGVHAPHQPGPAVHIAPVAQTTATLEPTTLTVVEVDGSSPSSRSYTTGAAGVVVDGE